MGTRSHRLLAACALSGLAGCATTVPIQTASTVPVGTVRASGQASLGVYCGFADLDRCAFGGSTPELRLALRTGLHDRVDLGGSAYFVGKLEGSAEWGGLLDAKVELWRAPIDETRKQVLAVGLGVPIGGYGGYHNRQVYETGVVVPVRYGYQLKPLELFVGAHFRERLVLGLLERGRVADVPAGGFTVGMVSRKRAKVGLTLNYEAPLRYFGRGAITLGLGFLFDVNGRYQRRGPPLPPGAEPPSRPPSEPPSPPAVVTAPELEDP